MSPRLIALLVAAAMLVPAAHVPTPAEHLGFSPGEDFKLADYSQIATYFQKLAQASDRIRVVEFGRSSHGKPTYVAFISAPENLRELERYRDTNRRLALGLASADEAQQLAATGKAFVWIDSGLHSTEVAPAQHAPELAYRMVTAETPEVQQIRQHVILMQVPVINPDGHDWVVEWYRRNVGTPHELAPLPRLYQKYAGHDNNRDWFMLNLQETRNVTRLLFREWYPHIVYNQHQQPAFPARIFVPPYADPLNPNIPAAVMEGANMLGAAMKERFARENKAGALSYLGFDAWWNGGLRTSPPFHNMHGILTETASGYYGTPREDKLEDLPKSFPNGLPTTEPSIFYAKPWLGGRWGVREAIEYMLTADFAILDFAAHRPEYLLLKAHQLALDSIESGRKGNPFAYIVPAAQWDRFSADEMLRRLLAAGVEIRRAKSEFSASGNTYAAGSHVLPAAQPFRPYLIDLMEPQKYPELRDGSGGPTKRPYDVAGWTLRMSMGVEVHRVDAPFEAPLEPVGEIPHQAPARNHQDNSSFLALAALLDRGAAARWGAEGDILVEGEAADDDYANGKYQLKKPRTALYESWVPNADAGWSQWVLDTFRIPYRIVHDEDFRHGRLDRYDSILLASQSATSILHGQPAEEPTIRSKSPLDGRSLPRPEHCGGIGLAGLHHLERFVANGGTLIALDQAADLPVELFPLAVTNVLQTSRGFYCPGSLLHIQVDQKHPLSFGLPGQAVASVTGGRAYDINLLTEQNRGERTVQAVASFPKNQVLASGWISGESAIQGKHALLDVRHGKGRVILFGFRPQFRGQTFGTFKFLLNAIYLASAKVLNG